MERKLDHIGIAVQDLEAALGLWRDRLGFPLGGVEEVPGFGVKVAFLPLGEGKVELVCPTSPEAAVARFLEKKGPGIHHLCFRVEDIRAELARLKEAGVALVDEEPRPGAHGSLVAFLHPRDTGGVLLELVQHPHEGE